MRGITFGGLCASLALSACGGGGVAGPMGPGADLGNGNDPGTNDAGVDPGAALMDVPCDVSALLTQCVACHGNTPAGGAHVSLLSRADLEAASPTRAGTTVAEEAVARLTSSGTDRMPPAGARPSDADIAALEAWIDDGMPAGDCGSIGVDDAFSGPTVCTSGEHWTRGDEESPQMHPGRACIDCHTEEDEGPDFSLAGTVFRTGHEPDDCLGASGSTADITIEVTDADGKVVRMSPNRSGNFFSESNLNFPITARVLYDGRVRAMATPVNEGDCNGCHTESGREDAPGRIALP